MARVMMCAAVLALGLPTQAQDATGGPAWKFVKGTTRKYEIEYVKYYRMKGAAPEMEGKEVYKDHLKATVSIEVTGATGDAADLKVRFLAFRAGLGGDDKPDASVYDSAQKAQNRSPMEWAAMVPELSPTIRVDSSGKVLSITGLEVDRHLPAVGLALFGDRFLSAPAGEGKGTIKVFHDLESGGQRFNLKNDTTVHDVPIVFTVRGEAVEGAVPEGTVVDLGKKGREFFLPGVAFTGQWKGARKDGEWTEAGWSVLGKVKTKIERKEAEIELHERYSARLVK